MKIAKVGKLVASLHDKTGYVIHIRFIVCFLKDLIEWVIKFNQNACLKPYIDMNTNLRKKKQTNNFEKVFLSWWIMQFLENEKFEKTQRSQTCHNRQKIWQKICLAIEIRKT